MRPHHRGLRCPKWKRQNVFTFSEAHKQHVALGEVFFQGVGLGGRTMGCTRKGGPCSYPLFKLILSGCQLLWLEFYFQVKRTSYALENTVLKKIKNFK